MFDTKFSVKESIEYVACRLEMDIEEELEELQYRGEFLLQQGLLAAEELTETEALRKFILDLRKMQEILGKYKGE